MGGRIMNYQLANNILWLGIEQVKTQESFTPGTENNYRSHSKTHKLIYIYIHICRVICHEHYDFHINFSFCIPGLDLLFYIRTT